MSEKLPARPRARNDGAQPSRARARRHGPPAPPPPSERLEFEALLADGRRVGLHLVRDARTRRWGGCTQFAPAVTTVGRRGARAALARMRRLIARAHRAEVLWIGPTARISAVPPRASTVRAVLVAVLRGRAPDAARVRAALTAVADASATLAPGSARSQPGGGPRQLVRAALRAALEASPVPHRARAALEVARRQLSAVLVLSSRANSPGGCA